MASMVNEKINEDDDLYRRGRIKWLNPDGTATSRVFKLRQGKDEGKLSTDLKRLTTPEISVVNKEEYNLFEISVVEVHNLNLSVIYDRLETNIAHCYIFGMDEDDDILPGLSARKSKRVFT